MILSMRRQASFLNLGRALILFGAILHAGCVFPIVQAWCDFVLCPPEMSITHGMSVSSASLGSDEMLCLHSPMSTDSMVVSHISEYWAPVVKDLSAEMLVSRFEVQTIKPDIEIPDLSIGSPPPKSSSISQI